MLIYNGITQIDKTRQEYEYELLKSIPVVLVIGKKKQKLKTVKSAQINQVKKLLSSFKIYDVDIPNFKYLHELYNWRDSIIRNKLNEGE